MMRCEDEEAQQNLQRTEQVRPTRDKDRKDPSSSSPLLLAPPTKQRTPFFSLWSRDAWLPFVSLSFFLPPLSILSISHPPETCPLPGSCPLSTKLDRIVRSPIIKDASRLGTCFLLTLCVTTPPSPSTLLAYPSRFLAQRGRKESPSPFLAAFPFGVVLCLVFSSWELSAILPSSPPPWPPSFLAIPTPTWQNRPPRHPDSRPLR